MANAKSSDTETDLREEFNALREQVGELLQALKAKGEEKAEKFGEKLEGEFEHYQDKAEEKFHDVYEAGDVSLKELNDRIRKNPTSSLLLAFAAGYVISKIVGQDK